MDSQETEKSSASQILMEVANTLPLFHDQNGEAFAFVNGECISLRSHKLKSWLTYTVHKQYKRAVSSEAMTQALSILSGFAIYDKNMVHLSNRLAMRNNAIYYDMGDNTAIEITTEGWKQIPAPIMFRRYSHQSKQVVPANSDGDPWKLFDFLNVGDEHRLLIMATLISFLVPDIPHPIIHPWGSQGAGKTFLCSMVKSIIDPSIIKVLVSPNDERELVQQLNNHYVCIFDNLSGISGKVSDILAMASTGGSFTKRRLHTDDGDVIFEMLRCVGINGINLQISRADLMDRTILLHLERITPDQRKEHGELWADFEAMKPIIFAGMLDTLSKAMAIYPTVRLTRMPRLADFARWGYAISEALGRTGEEFLADYQRNIERQTEEVVQGNTLCMAVLRLMDGQDSYTKPVKDAYDELHDLAEPERSDSTFPKDAKNLRKHLERIKATLMDLGIGYQISERSAAGYSITFHKVAVLGSSSTSATQTASEHDECNVHDSDSSSTKMPLDIEQPAAPTRKVGWKQKDGSTNTDGGRRRGWKTDPNVNEVKFSTTQS